LPPIAVTIQPGPWARYSLNAKTVAKWRKRATTADRQWDRAPKSTVLIEIEEAIVSSSAVAPYFAR
jgi:hypothetical protein